MSKTKPRFCLAAMNNSMDGIIQKIQGKFRFIGAFLRHMDVPPDSTARAVASVSKTKPRFCLAAMNNSMDGIIQKILAQFERLGTWPIP